MTSPVGTSRRSAALVAGLASTSVGALTALQSRINGEFARVTGSGLEAAVVSFGSGWILLTVLLLAWRRKLFFRLGSGVLLVGATLAFLAGSALGVYGKLSDRAAVMVVDVVPLRSVPTEVQQTEKAYPPGSIAHREKEFLGWSKVRMPNNDAGWIRTENLVPLY